MVPVDTKQTAYDTLDPAPPEIHLLYRPRFKVADLKLTTLEVVMRTDGAQMTPAAVDSKQALWQRCSEQLLRDWRLLDCDQIRLCFGTDQTAVGADHIELLHQLRQRGVPPRCLSLELAERTRQMKMFTASVRSLQVSGVIIATGIGSLGSFLSHLSDRSCSECRLDVGLLCLGEATQAAALDECLQAARSRNIRLTVSGIESEQQLRVAHARNFDFVQGDLLGRAQTMGRLLQTMRARRWL